MKTYIRACLLCLTILVLVAATRSGRNVKDNLFRSSSPKLQVKVDPKFGYLGVLDYTIEQQTRDRLQLVAYETKSYVFADAADKHLKKAVYIQIRREQTKYVGDLLGDAKADLKSGICNLGEKEYKCFTRLVFLDVNDPIAKFIADQGYSLPVCAMSRTYTRTDIRLGTYLIVITYLENLSDSALKCEDWEVKSQLTTADQQYIDQFDRNCKAAFSIVKERPERPGLKGLLGG